MYAQVCNVTSLWDQPALMPEYRRQSEFYVPYVFPKISGVEICFFGVAAWVEVLPRQLA